MSAGLPSARSSRGCAWAVTAPPPSSGLRRLGKAARERRRRADVNPLIGLDETKPQYAFRHCRDRFKLYRSGNRGGKTFVGARECVEMALGISPAQRIPPPLRIWVLTATRSQGRAVERAVWNLTPKDQLKEGHKAFQASTGLGHHYKIIEFKNGSTIEFYSMDQGPIRLAGEQVHHVLVDEPPRQDVWSELLARVRATGGTISLTLTPIGRDCRFLREEVEAGKITDLHFKLTAENLRFIGSGRLRRTDAGDLMDDAWIEREKALDLAHLVPVRFDGEWESRVVGRMFTQFVSMPGVTGSHVSAVLPDRELVLCLGVDHGEVEGNQAAVLLGIDPLDVVEGYPHVYVLDEAWSPGVTTSEQDAEGILRMLERQGLEWSQLDHVFGDLPTGRKGWAGRKGNRDLEDALARRLNLTHRKELRPGIRLSKAGVGAGREQKDVGEAWIHKQMVRGQWTVHPRCRRMIESLDRYDGDSNSEWKHIIDAGRYGLADLILRRRVGRPKTAGGWKVR